MCDRNLRFPGILIAGGVLAGVAILFLLLASSNRLKNRVQNWSFSPEVVLKATETLVAKSPAVHNPIGFSALDQSTVEHWDAYRWRVSGFVETNAQSGGKLRTLYFAVVQNSGNEWRLEDLQLQNLEAARPAGRK
jgi:hypothetical protein